MVYSRRGHDWTEQFAGIARAAERLRVQSAVLDGEVIVQDASGVADYHALRRELARKNSDRLTYYAFDLLFLDGVDLRPKPLSDRKRRLEQILKDGPGALLYALHLEGDGEVIFEEACRMGVEGIVSKRADAPYRSGRQESWLKIKCTKSDTFPIIAFVEKLGAKSKRTPYALKPFDLPAVFLGHPLLSFAGRLDHIDETAWTSPKSLVRPFWASENITSF